MWREAIRRWLEENERPLAYLAKKAGVSREHLSRCMNGRVEAGPFIKARVNAAIANDRRM